MFNFNKFCIDCPFPLFNCKGIQYGKLLGKGGNASVYCVKMNNNKYAAKVYKNASDDQDLGHELKIAEHLKETKYSVQVHGVGYIQKGTSYDILLLMEYLVSHGDLYDYIQNVAKWSTLYWIHNQYIPSPKNNYIYYNKEDNIHWGYELHESQKIKITRSIVKGIQELHTKGIIHGDIKTNNMVLHYKLKKQSVKLIDFGMAYFTDTDDLIDIVYKCGTVGYRAPEQDDYTMCYLSDIYSMGITIIELWNGDIWIEEEDFQGCRREALAGLRKIEANNKAFGKLLRSSIALNYKKRPSAEKFLRRFNDIFNNDHKYRKHPLDSKSKCLQLNMNECEN